MAKSILLFLLGSIWSIAHAQNIDTAKQVYQSSNPSVFLIYLNDSSGKATAFGSGFEIGPHTIATNAHVIRGGTVTLAFGPVRVPAKVVKVDDLNDLAILEVSANLTSTPLPLATVQISPGEPVFAIGNPEGLEKTISQGIVSGIRNEGGRSLLQITSAISHGSSGGPVLNSRGEVVGIAVGMLTKGQNLNFAVPVSYLQHLLNSKEDKSALQEVTLSSFKHQVLELSNETFSSEPQSAYQLKIQQLKLSLSEASANLKAPSTLHEILCISYTESPSWFTSFNDD